MALLSIEQRKQYFSELDLGEYNADNILKVQKKYLLRKTDWDGVYGTNTDNLVRHLKAVKDNCQNFAPEEFRCGCNGRYCSGYPTYMKPIELANIQAIRTHYGKPMTVTCGVRCTRYNSIVGGIKNSEHLKGSAVDYYIAGVTDTLANRKKSVKWIKTLPNHHYTYGNGIYVETVNGKTYTGSKSASGMGNALHTDSRESASNGTTTNGKLIVDGVGGSSTVRAMQRFFGTVQDGVISGQNKACAKYYPALKAVEYGKGGSTCVKKLQKWLGLTEDGVWGQNTSKALQKKLGVEADGVFGTNSMKAWQKYLNENKKATYPKPSTPSVEPEKDKKVYDFIDVSDWQGEIDWAKVKAAGIDGAIIRYADGTTLDKRFEHNIKLAQYYGLHVGVYIFSRAKTKAQAEREAERLYKAASIFTPDMPYYIDLEAKGLEKYADTVAAAFLNKMAAYGVKGGVYANLNWWNNYLTKTAKDYSASAFWIAQYNDTMDYKPASAMGMWQYTSSGKVKGIEGKVDRDKCYVAYWDTKSNGEKIAEKAREFAYTTNSSKANYETGKPKEAYKKGLNEAYPDRSKWGKPPREGCSCDVNVGTCVRCAGVDKNYPRGLSKSYLAKSKKFVKVKMGKIKDFKSWMKNGDIIITDKHTCIYDNGKIKEASHPKWDEEKQKYVGGFYPKTTDKVVARLSADGAEVYRAK